jgi:hypothetical protein
MLSEAADREKMPRRSGGIQRYICYSDQIYQVNHLTFLLFWHSGSELRPNTLPKEFEQNGRASFTYPLS